MEANPDPAAPEAGHDPKAHQVRHQQQTPDTRGIVGTLANYGDNCAGRFFSEPWLPNPSRPCPQVNYNP